MAQEGADRRERAARIRHKICTSNSCERGAPVICWKNRRMVIQAPGGVGGSSRCGNAKGGKMSILDKLLFGAKQGSGRIGMGTLAKLPGNIGLFRDFLGAVNWKTAQGEIQWALTSKIALVGLPNSGKSTLFNTLKGKRISPVSPVAGTTKTLIHGAFGPFVLIDTPGHLPDIMQKGVQEAAIILLLIDGT